MNRILLSMICTCAAVPLASVARGQAAAAERGSAVPVGLVEQPCPPPATMTESARDLLVDLFMKPRELKPADFEHLMGHADFARYNDANRRLVAQDWPGLCRYRAANESLLKRGEATRVVFMGDSITENWSLADPHFFERGIVNRGIGGQTTPQMLVRFRADVIALKPRVVHIMAGTNDVAGNTGPSTVQDVKNNIVSMVEIAHANGIRVLLGSIPPAATFSWRPQLRPSPQIQSLNAWLRDYASRNKLDYIDYYSALAGASGELKAELGNDGVHPNRDGYRIMRKLVEGKISGR